MLPIRPLLPADLIHAHALTQAIRWPHRLEDWHFALNQQGRGLGARLMSAARTSLGTRALRMTRGTPWQPASTRP